MMQRSQPGDLASLEVLRLYEQAVQHAFAELVTTACRYGEKHAAQPVLILWVPKIPSARCDLQLPLPDRRPQDTAREDPPLCSCDCPILPSPE
jgi:hypothetical protein